MFFGAVSGYLGYIEIVSPKLLTTFAAYVTTAVGALLFLAGLAHFKAPHKAFLITIPLLIYFHLQMYFNAIFYFARPLWPQQLSLLLISALILGLSYYGYRKSKTSSAVSVLSHTAGNNFAQRRRSPQPPDAAGVRSEKEYVKTKLNENYLPSNHPGFALFFRILFQRA